MCENALEVRLQGLRTNIKASSDFLVGQSFRDQRVSPIGSLAASKISQAPLMTGGSREVMRKCAMIEPKCHS
jgi:hypothetical protein